MPHLRANFKQAAACLPLLQVAFLFSDTQIKDESFVEDLSNLINTYEVPNLLGSGDLAGIFENIRPRAKQAGMDGSKDALYNFFVQEVRRHLGGKLLRITLACVLRIASA